MKTFWKPYIYSLLILFSVSQKSIAQNEGLRFEHIGMEEGLSNDFVTAMLQDSKGYMWFGTRDGLNKYDGYSFTKYQFDPFDSNSLSQNFIYTIFEDKSGTIWLSTFEGLCKFDRTTEKFTRYKPLSNAKFSDPNISAINEDNEGMIWVGSWSGGLCRFDPRTGKFLPENYELEYHKLPGNEAGLHDATSCIYKDRAGTLWVTNQTGLHSVTLTPVKGKPAKVNITHYTHNREDANSLSSNNATSVLEDKAGFIWVTTSNGLNSFDRKTGIFKHYPHDPKNRNSISSNYSLGFNGSIMKEDSKGNLWIATDNGLNKLNKGRNQFTAYFHKANDPNSLTSNYISSLLIDQDGVLWAGSMSGKLNKTELNHKGFGLSRKDLANVNSLSNNQVTAIVEDSSGVIWIGTYGGGLNRWNKKTNQFTHYRHNSANSKSLRYDAIHAILKDRKGGLWVCNGDVLSRLNKQTGEFTHYNSNAANYKEEHQRLIYSITQDRQGLFWLGTGNGVKTFNEHTGKFTHYYYHPGDTNGISDYTALAIYADSRDNIWIGFGSIATDRYDKKTGRFTHYKHNPQDTNSISSNIVSRFYEDSKGNFWLGTSAGGLCYFDYQKEKFTTFTDKHGLQNNTVFSILEDSKGLLWLGTQNGLSRFDPVAEVFTNYTYKDGLQSNFFAGGVRPVGSCFKGEDGTLYFGGDNGFNFFNPNDLKANSNLAPIVITQFKLFDQLIRGAHEQKEIVLNYNQNYFSFDFSSLSYSNPAKNQYAYKLEGVDKDWVYSGSRRYVAYTNIDPGKYTFRVKGTNNDGVWNEKGTYISIVINPPWWRTWWVYSFYGACFIAGLFLIDRYQRKRVINKERDRTMERELQQAREIEKAYKELKTTQAQLIQSEKMASLGELTAGIAHEIQNPLNFVNNFSEVNKELIEEMKEELKAGNSEEAIALANDIKKNEEKINHHGKRADAIVKGMLQHSRSSSGVKEPSDINELADEYFRLAYHGIRAKDKTFNATMKTDFDDSIGNINIIPQDIGRVILNLITNAFYAVTEKKKQLGESYEPVVTVATRKLNSPGDGGKIEIIVKDNGNGIPQKVMDKIFQPFFTTKPTGEGTGLGLSLSYDIIKAHGGEIKVETKEGKGSEFIIHLPVTF